MGTSDYEELDFRDLKRVRHLEAARVRRELLWWRIRTWALIAAIVLLPSALAIWVLWEYSR